MEFSPLIKVKCQLQQKNENTVCYALIIYKKEGIWGKYVKETTTDSARSKLYKKLNNYR